MTLVERVCIAIIIFCLAVAVAFGPEWRKEQERVYQECVSRYIDEDTPAFARLAIEDECEDRAFGDD